jgi:pimeloyl-ACP methyl ester carboxylesterase
MKKIIWLSLIILGLCATAGVGAWPWSPAPRAQAPQNATTEYRTYCVAWESTHVDSRPLVWVLDGAGDLKGSSNALALGNSLAGNPVELSVFPWSHGYGRLLEDQVDMNHARNQGAKLAQAILERKAREPGRRVVVVGHSAGCAVALAAGDVLPIDAVDRVILLAPSVSTGYDIRPTLWSAREGVDVFCSTKDWVALGFVLRVVGTTDKFWSGAAAGRWGFQPKGSKKLAELEASRLRQHFWSQEVAWTGHTGGHHGMHAPGFVQAYLLPIMVGSDLAVASR